MKFSNSIGMEFVLIPTGTFTMGTPDYEYERFYIEGPQHRVALTREFYMGVTVVTQAEWEAVMGQSPSFFESNESPVENISWNDAMVFCVKLSKRDGMNYRLPTEAEWEYACRANASTAYGHGDNRNELDAYAWYQANSDRMTHPVRKKKANALGLFDMHGNVWEWCSDWYGNYSQADQTDPKGPVSGIAHIIRGGSWSDYPHNCRSGSRSWLEPQIQHINVGVRIVLDSPWMRV